MNIIQKIEELIQTDDCNQEKQSAVIESLYADASVDEKQAIDHIFIALCGYSLETILKGV